MELEHFADLLIRSGLSGKPEVQSLLATFQDECNKRNMQVTLVIFCDFLVSTNRLTNWQCEKLRMGKYKGFYFDNYLLLEQIGKDYDSMWFKCRDTRDGMLVRLTVTPREPLTATGIEYRVEPYCE